MFTPPPRPMFTPAPPPMLTPPPRPIRRRRTAWRKFLSFMRRSIFFIGVITGYVLVAIGASLLIPALNTPTNSHCTTNQLGGLYCPFPTDPSASQLPLLGSIGIVILVTGGIIYVITWVSALVRCARRGNWRWFAIILLFSGLGTLAYALAGAP